MEGSRRTFLRAGGAALMAGGAGWLGFACKRKREAIPGPEARAALGIRGTIVGPGRYLKGGEEHYILSMIDLDRGRVAPRFVTLGFRGHGVSPHPEDARRAVIFEKQGPGSCEVDLGAGEVTRTITTAPERWFYGHGAWSKDGALLYATETVLATGAGTIVVRDGKTFAILGEFSTHGAKPHDCVLIDSGRVLAITNGGGPGGGPAPSVTYVDVNSQKLLDKVLMTSPSINAGHLAMTPAGDLAVVSAPREGLADSAPGGVTLRPAGTTAARTMVEPKAITTSLSGESLSVSIHERTGIVGVTNPKADLVTFWNIREQRFVSARKLPHPRGIAQTLDQKRFLVSYGPQAGFIEFTTDTLEPLAGTGLANAGLAGSHFIVHSLGLPASQHHHQPPKKRK